MEHYHNVEIEQSEGCRRISLSLDDLISVYWKEEFSYNECAICGYVKPTSWEATTNKSAHLILYFFLISLSFTER